MSMCMTGEVTGMQVQWELNFEQKWVTQFFFPGVWALVPKYTTSGSFIAINLQLLQLRPQSEFNELICKVLVPQIPEVLVPQIPEVLPELHILIHKNSVIPWNSFQVMSF